MFEQRFDHICFAHEEAMAAMQERVRTVLAARGAPTARGGPSARAADAGGGQHADTGDVRYTDAADARHAGAAGRRHAGPAGRRHTGPAGGPDAARSTEQGPAVPPGPPAGSGGAVAGSGGAVAGRDGEGEHAGGTPQPGLAQPGTPWPERIEQHAGAPLFDPRWNSDAL